MKSPLIIILLFCFSFINAQTCPTIGNPGSYTLNYIQFNVGSDDQNSYPATIQILDATGLISVTYTKETGWGSIAPYSAPSPQPSSGITIDLNNFTVDFGLGAGNCQYINGILPVGDFELSSNNITLYPNPLKNNELLSIGNLENGNLDVFIYDITGKMVIKKLISNNRSLKVNVSNLNQGIYLVKLVSDKKSITQKLIVAN